VPKFLFSPIVAGARLGFLVFLGIFASRNFGMLQFLELAAYNLKKIKSIILSFLVHHHQDSVFARRHPRGMEGRRCVLRKIAVQRGEKFRGFRFFLA